MGKKKKKKKRNDPPIKILKEVDETLSSQHEDIMQEIEELQYRLYVEDQKAKKKIRMKLKKNPNYFSSSKERVEVRKKVLGEMESTNLLERAYGILNKLGPIIALIGRLVASLINMILSIDEVKVWIKPETLAKMEKVYQVATSIAV